MLFHFTKAGNNIICLAAYDPTMNKRAIEDGTIILIVVITLAVLLFAATIWMLRTKIGMFTSVP